MTELLDGFLEIPFWSMFADFHGLLSMLSLLLFGGALTLYFLSSKTKEAVVWLRTTLLVLFLDIFLLDIFGLTVYIPYRAEGGAKFDLLASETTAWLHTIVFEHKEFLAFAPLIMTAVAFFVVARLGESFIDAGKYKWLRLAVLFSLLLSLVFVLTVAAEAVLVTKTAPVGGR
ncbi:MAG TPA: hypothetical protein VIH52_02760 [Candidatus Nanoarchaeia archaeon]|nr:hypothetical protein [uncultured archaeon]